jgi:glycerophosphoryl diester phosphodiesterase
MRALAFRCLLLLVAVWAAHAAEWARPLTNAHAHNDYLHPRPLLDALAHGFWSVEADIWLTNGALLVAHDLPEAKPGRTLQSLYLDPLRALVRTNRSVSNTPPFTLLIDVKSEAESTWQALARVLAGYEDILTRFESNRVQTNAVLAIISGNRARHTMERQAVRYAAVDGRLPDLALNAPVTLVPMISDNWTKHFRWRGPGELPAEEKKKLRELVLSAHAQGRRIRFWAVPDQPAGWRALREAGVDLINTDRLAELQAFLR